MAMAIVLVGLLGLVALEGGDSAAPPPAARAAPVDIATIVARVEALRGLRFEERPVPVNVSPARARDEGLAEFDRTYPQSRRRADEEVLKLLGLIEPDDDVRALAGSIFGEGVAGYYDPRTQRMRIVEGAAPGPLADMVLAHELTHALEDQRFDLELDSGTTDDAALARLALVEGTAMLVMQEYLLRHIGAEQALSGLLGSAFSTGPDLPKFLQDQLIFPYLDGMRFAQALREQDGGGWTLLDLAARERVPDSTEQILHPEKWVEVETPERVALDVELGAGWRRTARGTWGEWQTAALIGGDAAGWGGDRYELWQRGTCAAAPCRSEDVLVMRWSWDTDADAAEFEAALRAAPVASGDGAAVSARGDTVTLVLAPSAGLARRLSASA
jgi:hypothetical protein